MDGALGTQLLDRVGPAQVPLPRCNASCPEVVQAIHRDYVSAGAQVLLTNTFNFTPPKGVVPPGLEEVRDLCRRGVALARTAASGHPIVLGSVGPMDFPNPHELTGFLEAFAGVDGILFETQSSLELFTHAVEIQQKNPSFMQFPFLLSLTFRTVHGIVQTIHGESPEALAVAIRRLQPLALGVNCGADIGQIELLQIVQRYRDTTDLPLLARPNAGTPVQTGPTSWRWPVTPAAFADMVEGLLDAGVQLIGGCCGTSPAHTAAARQVIAAWNRKCL